MATARSAHPVRLLILIAAIAGLLASVMGGSAQAANNNTIEQHWELLADTVTGQIGEKRLFIKRGDLPGGTTGFEPAPSATMEAVAKVTGAGNASSGYDIQALDTGGSIIASVPFRGSDSDFTLEKTSSPFAWNSSTRAISELKIVPVGTIPGAIDLKKAYFKFRQSGTVKRTIGRVPLASKSLGITRADFGDLPDLLTYSHVAGDFNPAPTVQLRVTAAASLCTLKVALVNLGTGLPVSDSELAFTGLSSQTTGPLTLNHGDTRYKIQAKAEQTNCGTQSQSGPQQQSGEPGAAGDVLGADLILSQSTTDAKGLVRTVGWYPGVTASTAVAQNNLKLGFQFNSPVMTVPNNISSKWLTMVKLSTGTGVGAHLAYASSGNTYTTSPLSSATSWVALESSITSLPSSVTAFDSKAALTGTGAAGTISGSMIRSALHLWDVTIPVKGSFTANPPYFSPGVSLGSQDTTTCSVPLSDYSPVSWTIEVRAGTTDQGELQRSVTGSGMNPTASYTWNGTKATGPAIDGVYTCWLIASDDSGNAITPKPSVRVTLDRVAPTITGFQSSVPRISPTNGPPTSTTFTATISEPVTWTISIAPTSGGPVVRTFTGSTTNISQVWDGRTTGGALAADNDYTATLAAIDNAGNSSSVTTAITVDKTGPTIANYLASNRVFSPGVSPGIKDTTTLSATLSDPWTPIAWTVEIADAESGQFIRQYSGTGSPVGVQWDGTDALGIAVGNGVYTANLQTYDGGNNARSSAIPLVVDLIPPGFIREGIAPADDSHVLAGELVARARIIEPNITTSEITFTISDVTSGVVATRTGTAVTRNGNSVWVDPINIADGHDYRMSITATDEAGNTSNFSHTHPSTGGGFRGITVTEAVTQQEIPPSQCQLSDPDLVTQTRQATCAGAVLQIDPSSVVVSRSAHEGKLHVRHSVSLDGARVSTLGGGIGVPAWTGNVPVLTGTSGGLSAVSASAQTLSVPGLALAVPSVTVTVPAWWQDAYLSFDDTSTPEVRSCREPSMDEPACSPDPIRPPVELRFDPPLTYAEVGTLPFEAEGDFHVMVDLRPVHPSLPYGGGVIVDEINATLDSILTERVHSIVSDGRQSLTAFGDPGTDASYFQSVESAAHPYVVPAISVMGASRAQAEDYYARVASALPSRVEASYAPVADPSDGQGGAVSCTTWSPSNGWYGFWESVFSPPAEGGGDEGPPYQYFSANTIRWSTSARLSAFSGNNDSGFEINATLAGSAPANGYCLPDGDCSAVLNAWLSGMPSWYLETVTFDDTVQTLGLGTHDAQLLEAGRYYHNWWQFYSGIDYNNFYTPDQWLYGQYDLDMYCGSCGDIGFWSDGADRLTPTRTFPFSAEWNNTTCG